MTEEWRQVPDLDDLEVSSLGRIRRVGRVATGMRDGAPISQRRAPAVLSPWIAKNGYLTVSVMTSRIRKKYTLHRLIARAFVPGYADGLTVNHIDGNKLNNLPTNLEWITLEANTAHEWAIGLVNLRGERSPGVKLSYKRVLAIRKALRLGVPANALAVIADVSPALICLIRDGKRWPELKAA